MSAPLVSVVVPCFNGARYVQDAVESVLAQTHRPVEVVVVDDGSSDGSREILERLAAQGHIVLEIHDHNRGISAARNSGIVRSTGPFVAFLDQDDRWEPGKVEAQLRRFAADASGEVGAVVTDVAVIDERRPGRPPTVLRPPDGVEEMGRSELLAALYERNFVVISSMMVRRACFDRVGLLAEDVRSGVDDYDFVTRLAGSYRLGHVPEALTVRRIHDANYTDDERFYPDVLGVLDRMRAAHPDVRFDERRRRAGLLYGLGRAAFARGDRAAARARFVESLRAYPWAARPVLGVVACSLGPLGTAAVRAYRRVLGRLRSAG